MVVVGDTRITGILTVGSSSLTLDGNNDLVNVGTALTLGHTQGIQFHTQSLHAQGFEVNNVNASGIVTAASLDISGNVDVDGTLEADAITIDGVSLAETISDTVGQMVTSNIETGVSVT